MGATILVLSAVISIFHRSAAVPCRTRFLVGPIKGVVEHMQRYAAHPKTRGGSSQPAAGVTELREAEEALQVHADPTDRCAQAKGASGPAWLCGRQGQPRSAQHLTSAQLFTDRIEMIDDPSGRPLGPKLVNSITRAVHLMRKYAGLWQS